MFPLHPRPDPIQDLNCTRTGLQDRDSRSKIDRCLPTHSVTCVQARKDLAGGRTGTQKSLRESEITKISVGKRNTVHSRAKAKNLCGKAKSQCVFPRESREDRGWPPPRDEIKIPLAQKVYCVLEIVLQNNIHYSALRAIPSQVASAMWPPRKNGARVRADATIQIAAHNTTRP